MEPFCAVIPTDELHLCTTDNGVQALDVVLTTEVYPCTMKHGMDTVRLVIPTDEPYSCSMEHGWSRRTFGPAGVR